MKILVLLSLLLISFNVMADKRKEFIRKYKHIAIREMERTGIPASITLAQGILESGCGESELAVNANNLSGSNATKPGTAIHIPWTTIPGTNVSGNIKISNNRGSTTVIF